MNAFLGGSRAYGTPRPDSDTDIVILVDGEAMRALMELSMDADDLDQHQLKYGEESSKSFRFGKLNLIATTSRREFDAWYEGVQQLKAEAPVERGRAVTLFKQLLAAARGL